MEVLFCPHCHRAVCRLVPIDQTFDAMLDHEQLFDMEDIERQNLVRVLYGPGWKSSLKLDAASCRNIKIGCSTKGCKGGATLFKGPN